MFDFVRNHQKLMQFLLLLFIAPAFVLLGVNGYNKANGDADVLATVDSYKITQAEFDQVKRERIEQLRQQAGPSFDASVFDKPDVNNQLLQAIIAEYLLNQSVTQQYLTASPEGLRREVTRTPEFQKAGKFDQETYNLILSAQGTNAAQYESRLRFGLARQQVLDPLFQSVFFSKSVSERMDRAQLAGRVVQTRVLELKPVLANIKVTPEEVKTYYEANANEFLKPASAQVQYLVLSPAAVKAGLTASDEELRTYYEQNRERFSTTQERKVSHILLPAQAEGKSADELKQKAQTVLHEVKKNPARFAELAREHSIDTGSAAQGGELGFFGRGAMTKAFDEAMFALPKGQISDLVKTEFGYHILLVTDVRGGQIKPLEEVKAQITEEIRDQKARTAFAQAQGVFADKVYEGGRSFDEVAKQLKLTPQTFDNLMRTPSVQTPKELADPKVLEAIFSEDSIKNQNNTKAVNVGESLVSAHIVRYTKEEPQAFEVVKASIEQRLKQDKADAQVREQAEALVKALSDAKSDEARQKELASFSVSSTVSALGLGNVPQEAAEPILDTALAKLPIAKVIPLKGQGYMVAWVSGEAALQDVMKNAGPQVLEMYRGISLQSWQAALQLASRQAIGERIGVKIKKTF